MMLTGNANACQSISPTVICNNSPTTINPPPIRKPSASFHGLFHIVLIDKRQATKDKERNAKKAVYASAYAARFYNTFLTLLI